MLGSYGQGELALYVTFVATLVMIAGLGLSQGMVVFIAAGKIPRSGLLLRTIIYILLAGIIIAGFVGLAITGGWLDGFLPEFILHAHSWIWVIVVQIVFTLLNSFFTAILQAEKKFIPAARIAMTGSICLLLCYGLRFHQIVGPTIMPLYWVISVMVFVLIIQSVLYLLHIYKTDKQYFNGAVGNWNLFKPLMLFSGMVFITNLVQFMNYKMDIWIINYFHTDKQALGQYTLAVSLAQMIWLLPAALQTVIYPYIAGEGDSQEMFLKIRRWTIQAGGYALIAGVAGYFAARLFLPTIFGTEFEPSVELIGILLLGIIPFALTMPLSAYFAARNKVIINLYAGIIGLVICLILDFLWIPSFHVIGAAWATVVSYLSTTLFLMILFFSRKMK